MRTHYGPWQHVEFQISTKNTNLVEDHPMNISGKFGSNLFSGFREECEKLTDGRRRTPSHDKSSHGLWPGELKTAILCSHHDNCLATDIIACKDQRENLHIILQCKAIL